MNKLTLDDIKDQRAYERERAEFRARIIAMKKRRRIQLGPLLTLTFENTDTMRFQVQEMARVERMLTDEQIQHEVDTYNELIPGPGQLSATLFIEIDDTPKLYEWLPKLVGIQRAVSFWLPEGTVVSGEPLDEEYLVREETTTTVHYLRFTFIPEQVDALSQPGARIVVDHQHYDAVVELSDEQRDELVGDLRG
ncbi:MAG TPA: DUF3501 family protein [Acidimicrobiia bacterium]|jgi:hypothetical protein